MRRTRHSPADGASGHCSRQNSPTHEVREGVRRVLRRRNGLIGGSKLRPGSHLRHRLRAPDACDGFGSGPPSRPSARVGSARASPAQVAGEDGLELQDPAPDGFVADLDTALGREVPHVTAAEHEANVEPDDASDDLGRDMVSHAGDDLHVPTLPASGGCRDNAFRIHCLLRTAPLTLLHRKVDMLAQSVH